MLTKLKQALAQSSSWTWIIISQLIHLQQELLRPSPETDNWDCHSVNRVMGCIKCTRCGLLWLMTLQCGVCHSVRHTPPPCRSSSCLGWRLLGLKKHCIRWNPRRHCNKSSSRRKLKYFNIEWMNESGVDASFKGGSQLVRKWTHPLPTRPKVIK